MVHISSLSYFREFFKGLPELLNTPIVLKERRITLSGRQRSKVRRSRNAQVLAGGTPFVWEGDVDKGQVTLYGINGRDFVVTPETFVLGELRAGAFARIKGVSRADVFYAQSIILTQR